MSGARPSRPNRQLTTFMFTNLPVRLAIVGYIPAVDNTLLQSGCTKTLSSTILMRYVDHKWCSEGVVTNFDLDSGMVLVILRYVNLSNVASVCCLQGPQGEYAVISTNDSDIWNHRLPYPTMEGERR